MKLLWAGIFPTDNSMDSPLTCQIGERVSVGSSMREPQEEGACAQGKNDGADDDYHRPDFVDRHRFADGCCGDAFSCYHRGAHLSRLKCFSLLYSGFLVDCRVPQVSALAMMTTLMTTLIQYCLILRYSFGVDDIPRSLSPDRAVDVVMSRASSGTHSVDGEDGSAAHVRDIT